MFGPPISTPDDELFTPPDWLLKAIMKIAVTSTPKPTKPPLQFSTK